MDRTEYDAGGFADQTVLDGDRMTGAGRFTEPSMEGTEPSEPGIDNDRTLAVPQAGSFDPAPTMDDRPRNATAPARDWPQAATTRDENVEDEAAPDPPPSRPRIPVRKVRVRERNRAASPAQTPAEGRLKVLPGERPPRPSSQVRVISEDAASAKASGRAPLGRLRLEVDEPELEAERRTDGARGPLILPAPSESPSEDPPRRARPRMSTLNRLMHLAQRSVGRAPAEGPDGLKIYRAVQTTESAARIIPILLGGMLLLFTVWIAATLAGRPGAAQQPHVELSILHARGAEDRNTRFARLAIETEPAGLLVVLDDEILGKTPFDAMLNLPDANTVGVRLHGPFFETWVGELKQAEDGSYALTARLTRN